MNRRHAPIKVGIGVVDGAGVQLKGALRVGERWRLPALLAAAAAVRIPTFGQPITLHHGWRQTQTAMTIRNFSRYGVDLLRPEVPIFGRRSVVVYEFPLFQAIAAQLTRFGLSSAHSGRTVGLLSLLVSGVLTTLVARRFVGRKDSLVAGAALLFSPFSLFWGSSVMIEYFAVALLLGTVLAVFRWNETDQTRWLFVATAIGCLAAAVKFSTVVPWAVVIALIFSVEPRSRLRRVVAAAGVLLPTFVVGIGWSLWADHVKEATEATRQLTTSGMIRSSIDAMPRLAGP